MAQMPQSIQQTNYLFLVRISPLEINAILLPRFPIENTSTLLLRTKNEPKCRSYPTEIIGYALKGLTKFLTSYTAKKNKTMNKKPKVLVNPYIEKFIS
ncbi:hypothetical protein WA1_50380 [Scytonema hofmannii PCC 7110]|uniref:Uncharacterized protein n=1 Tax=Scytonema hofmannii PCC 7110 TaxID=128403 RepID=A0A139WR75_9CYAN|nr:hypothetical protein WA1_50380 [Scytonema hofmannii PCC 7110]